ncbi:helix-turn-helix domain-containing protein [Aerococcus urinaeequi]|uniref:helix-turn-helix domain-containing protein n=2 Tax=Aerococcus TaxID=1375 RepID=UPI003D6A5774
MPTILVKLFRKEEKRGEKMKNNLAVILANKHLKITDVFEGTGVSKTTLTQIYYERDINPTTNTIIKIADFLNCSVDELLARTPYVVEV